MMKTLHLGIITLAAIVCLGFELEPVQADTNGISIQDIQVQPTIIRAGDTFAINATLVNNSTSQIFVEHGHCEAPFSATFDSHVLVRVNNITCTTDMVLQKLDPGEKITATSPYSDVIYVAAEAGTANATVTFSYSIWDQINQSNIEKTISESFLFAISNPSSQTTSVIQSPLEQFKSGIQVSNIQCTPDLSLVIKAEDGSPACIAQDNISKLILRDWISTTSSLGQNNTIFGDFYQGIENDSGIVSIKNQTYYMMTASNTTYPIAHGMTVKFHNVTFSFPYGAQATPGGDLIPFDMTFPDGTTEAYGNVTKNSDGSGSMSGISLGPGPSSNRTVTVQSDHRHPQAGVTLTENQIKLLVSTDADTTITQTPENHTLPASFEPCQDPYPQKYQGIPTLYMSLNSTGKICVRYHNLNDFPVRIGVGISEANNLTQDANDVSTWNDSGNNTISAGDSTIVYWVKTGNHKGLYGLTIFCVPMPFAVDYDNSTLGKNNFPWLGHNTWFCPAEPYDFHIDSTTGFKVGYIAEK